MNKYQVVPNRCGCHPETCCCNDYAVVDEKGNKYTTCFREAEAEDIARLLNTKTDLAAQPDYKALYQAEQKLRLEAEACADMLRGSRQDAEKVGTRPSIRKDLQAVLLSLDVPVYGHLASHSQTLHKTSKEIDSFESAIPLVSQAAHRRACDQIAALIPAPCKGKNCEATNGMGHSQECQAEHDAAIGYVTAQPAPALAGDDWLAQCDGLINAYTNQVLDRNFGDSEKTDPLFARNALLAHARKRVQPASGEDALPDDAEVLSMSTAIIGQRVADARDAERFRWLTDDHENRNTRSECNAILHRMPSMSYSAACADIDAAMQQGGQS